MKKLFEACHNYAKTKDGSYFKLLRETAFYSLDAMASRFIIEGTKWQPSARDIEALENGTFEDWHPDLGYSVVKAFDVPVFDMHRVLSGTNKPMKKVTEAEFQSWCNILGFKFTTTRRKDGTSRYRITDPATKLFYDHEDFHRIISATRAALTEHESQKASQPKVEKTVEPFDPFDL